MIKRTIAFTSIAVGAVVAPSMSHAGMPPGVVASEWTQLANNFQLHTSYLTQYQSMLQEIQTALNTTTQVQQGVTNLTKLPDDVWAQVQFNLGKLREVATNVNALGYAAGNVDARWRSMYQGYKPTQDFYRDYGKLAQDTETRVKKALNAADISVDDVGDMEKTLSILQSRSQSAVGQLQAVQAGNAISLVVADQLSRMRLLMRTQMDMQQAYLQRQVELEDMREGTRKQSNTLDVRKLESERNSRPRR